MIRNISFTRNSLTPKYTIHYNARKRKNLGSTIFREAYVCQMVRNRSITEEKSSKYLPKNTVQVATLTQDLLQTCTAATHSKSELRISDRDSVNRRIVCKIGKKYK